MTAFDQLSDEGKMQKIKAHISEGWPVPAGWVRWLMTDPALRAEYVKAYDEESARLAQNPRSTIDKDGKQ